MAGYIRNRMRNASKLVHNTHQGDVLVEPYGEVLWSGTKDTEFQKRQQRQASELEANPLEKKRSSPYPRRQHLTSASKEDQTAIDLRSNRLRCETAIRTSGLPRGEFVKT